MALPKIVTPEYTVQLKSIKNPLLSNRNISHARQLSR